jgi:hypothetical protein
MLYLLPESVDEMGIVHGLELKHGVFIYNFLGVFCRQGVILHGGVSSGLRPVNSTHWI